MGLMGPYSKDEFKILQTALQFEGQIKGFWVGTVISNTDPQQLARCQVRIYGLHTDNLEDIPQEALPWASTLRIGGGSSGIGPFAVYVPGTIVLGIMLDTAGQQPVIIGSLDHIASKSETQKTDPTITNFPSPPDNEISKETREDPTVGEPPYEGEKVKIRGDKVDSFGIEIAGSSNPEKIYNYLTTTMDLTPEQSAAFVGTVFAESSYDPKAINPAENAIGIIQWQGSRRTELENFAADNKLDINHLSTQMMFVTWELTEGEESRHLAKIKAQKTLENGVKAWNKYYVRPKAKFYDFERYAQEHPSFGKRLSAAEAAFTEFARGGS